MSDDSLLAELAEEFTRALRAGKSGDIEAYARRHPELAERIRELFPTLMVLEGMAAAGDTAMEVPPPTISPGSALGRYRIEREIGRGGMGIVYEAIHVLLEKRIALKPLPVRSTEDAGHLERFLREARTAAGLHHTNIVPVFDVGQVGGTPYYAMQYIEGRGLNEIIRYREANTGKARSPGASAETEAMMNGGDSSLRNLPAGISTPTGDYFRWVAGIGVQVAEGLAYARERKVVHRDIKPSNLLLDEQGVAWITDFGLARRIEDPEMTHSGTLVGTPRYMSPEQAQAATHPVDHRSDIYSLGATLYELLTSRPVFEGKTPLDVISQILTREPVAPRRLNPDIPADLATIVMKAMAKAPEDRYQSAQDLADDLHLWLNLEPIHARRIGAAGRLVRWCRRNPRIAAVTGIAAALIVVLSGIYYASLLRENANTRAALKQEQEARTAAEMTSYAANLAAAESYLRSNSYFEAEQLLEACSPNRRGWEWQHLNLRMNPESATIRLNSVPSQLTLSADGSKVLWLSEEENRIMAVDIRSQKLAPFPKAKTEGDENAGPPYIIAFRRDGKRIARTLWKGRFYHIDFGDKWIGYTAFENRDAILAFQNTGKRDPLRNILEIADNLYDVATSGIKFSNAGMWKGEKSIFGLFAGPPAMPGMSGNVISAVFSADGTRFATWTWDGSIQINHTDSGKILCALPRDPNYVTKVTFNSNADSIAAGNVAGSVYVCSVPSGTRIAVLRGYTAPITDLAFRPDGKQIASCSYDGTVRLWDLSVGRFVRTFKGVGIAPLVFSANGERMIAGSHVIEMNAKRKPIFPSELKIGVTSATFDSSGRRIISTPGDKTIRFWDGNLLSYVTTLEIPNGMITSALWNPDGRHIAMNVSTYRPSKWPSPFTNPDGRSAVIWDFVSGEAASIFNWQREADLGETTFNPSAGKVAAVFDNEIQLLSLRPGSQPLSLAIPKGRINRVAFSGNGKTIASADTEKTIALWDASSGRLLRTMTGQADRAINWLEFSPDGRRLVSAGSDKMMRIWDVATGNLLAILRGYKDAVSKAVFSPDGRLVLSTSSDNTVRVWESSGGKENFSFSCDNANALFDQEGSRIYAGCSDGTLGVWNMETGILLARSKSYRGYFRSLTFSPDRSRLIAAVGGTIKIWDAASLTLLLTMPDHDGSVESVAFSPDGSMILSVCNDGSARIWKSRRND